MIYTSTIGFPRIGERRELKKAIESFWKGKINQNELLDSSSEIKKRNFLIQKEKRVDIIPSGDFSFYDLILDHAVMFSQVPERYLKFGSPLSTDVYFAMARGKDSIPPLEMTKWFDTNYHYTVPDLGGEFKLAHNRPLLEYNWANKELGIKTKPIIIGIYTFLKLCKIRDEKTFKDKITQLAPCYHQILDELAKVDVEYIQIDEPALVLGEDKELVKFVGEVYKNISVAKGKSKWILQTYFEDISEHWKETISWPFEYIGLDFMRGEGNLQLLKSSGFPKDKKLALGVIDGRNIWKSNLNQTLSFLKEIQTLGLLDESIIQPSSSLMFVPYSLKGEIEIPKEIKKHLSFATEKLEELSLLKDTLNSQNEIQNSEKYVFDRGAFRIDKVQERIKGIKESDFHRTRPFSERKVFQLRRLNLPPLPTTTIGSFPQTEELRKIRLSYKSKKISENEYREYIKKEITSVLSLQEGMGIDVLVHGEFERTDMVEFFAEKLKGFIFTKNGWVQSYGTRCVRPPIIYGDVERTAPMTVEETTFAQSQTIKPVKGMLTGPITIINWSFVRQDISKEEIAYQIALALRDETKDLEKGGIKIIQIDEPALREGLPLKKTKREDYLGWTVKAFKLCSSGVKDDTQIHTHMCYSEFNEIIRTIYDLDADVISIENARSSDELLSVFKEFNYDHYIGPGVYDIHSKLVPSVKEIEDKIKKISNHIKKELIWINPDCGLKTRDYSEAVKSLNNMVKAAENLRKSL